MYKPIILLLTSLMLWTLPSPILGDESTKEDFAEYARVMDGEFVGRIILWNDIPGIGKKGDKLTVRWLHKVIQKGNAFSGNGSDDKQGTAASFYYYDGEMKQIRGITVFNGGTVVSSVVVKRGDDTWERKNNSVDPDGTKTESLDVLVVSDGGSTHTWTRDGKPLVWWRLPR
jgi:hypothetical protein